MDPRAGLSGSFVRIEGGLVVNEDELRTARETDTHSSGTPNWTNATGFEQDVFTFTRVIFKSDPGSRSSGGRLRWLGWWVDYPDADLNLSYRLQQVTAIRTDPDARVLKLTDPKLPQYPLLYME
ncbi:MAG: transmembrane prediction, partial [Verrucomicrobia bacterium]